jgi:hypothetical protein
VWAGRPSTSATSDMTCRRRAPVGKKTGAWGEEEHAEWGGLRCHQMVCAWAVRAAAGVGRRSATPSATPLCGGPTHVVAELRGLLRERLLDLVVALLHTQHTRYSGHYTHTIGTTASGHMRRGISDRSGLPPSKALAGSATAPTARSLTSGTLLGARPPCMAQPLLLRLCASHPRFNDRGRIDPWTVGLSPCCAFISGSVGMIKVSR